MTQIQECRGGCKGTHPTICEQEGCAIVQGEYSRAKKEARKMELAAIVEEICDWVEDYDGVWSSACDNAFVFNDGGPKENDFKYCPYCRKKIKEQTDT